MDVPSASGILLPASPNDSVTVKTDGPSGNLPQNKRKRTSSVENVENSEDKPKGKRVRKSRSNKYKHLTAEEADEMTKLVNEQMAANNTHTEQENVNQARVNFSMAYHLSLKERGNEAFYNGKYEDALSFYTKALNETSLEDMEKAVVYKNKAACFLKMEKYQEAVDDATRCLVLTPNDTKALYRRSQAYERLGKIEEAYDDALVITKVDHGSTFFKKWFQNLSEKTMTDDLIQTELRIVDQDDGEYFSIKTFMKNPDGSLVTTNESLIKNGAPILDQEEDDDDPEEGIANVELEKDIADDNEISHNKNDEMNEIQVASGEGDLQRHYNSCDKKSGHPKFIPVNDFNISHLHSYHDNDHVELIKAAAGLTVKIEVRMTNESRPEFWPNTSVKYISDKMRESSNMRSGTGMVSEVYKVTGATPCECHKCEILDTPRNVCGWIRIRTARHVVFDEDEAEHITCRFFYDTKDSPLITLNGWTVEEADTYEDWCDLECPTCDEELLDKLEKLCTEWTESYEKVNCKCMSSRDDSKWTFMVSHPHGCPKQVSVGKWFDRYITKNNRCKYTYGTSSCPGSSGACVHSLGYNHFYRILHVHSGVSSEDENLSGSAWGSVRSEPPDTYKEDYLLWHSEYSNSCA